MKLEIYWKDSKTTTYSTINGKDVIEPHIARDIKIAQKKELAYTLFDKHGQVVEYSQGPRQLGICKVLSVLQQ